MKKLLANLLGVCLLSGLACAVGCFGGKEQSESGSVASESSQIVSESEVSEIISEEPVSESEEINYSEEPFLPSESELFSEVTSVSEGPEYEVIDEWIWNDVTQENVDDVIYLCNGGDKTDSWGRIYYQSEVGGKTGGFYRLVSYVNFQQSCGLTVLPKLDKAYYEGLVAADPNAKLEIDFYYESGHLFSIVQHLNKYNLGSQTQLPADTWHTFSIPMTDILNNWDKILKGQGDALESMLIGVYGGDNTALYQSGKYDGLTFYVGGFRINTTATAPEVSIEIEKEETKTETVVLAPTWTTPGKNNGACDVWTASGTEKFVQGVEYSDRYSNKTLTISAFKNESESGQILITPKVDINYFYLISANLTDGKGNTLDKANFDIYHQKYIELENILNGFWPYEAGWYPDALLPQDAYVRAKENTIAAGNNQGIWITANIPEGQAAGVYTGTFEVVVDRHSYLVPVELTVYDYTLSDVQQSINRFSSNWTYIADFEGCSVGELSYEIKEMYYEFMLDNGLSSPGTLPAAWTGDFGWNLDHYDVNEIWNDDFVDNGYYAIPWLLDYMDCMAKYADDPRCTAYGLPTQSAAIPDPTDGKGTMPILEKLVMRRILIESYKYSMQNGIDILKKASVYLSWIDEYDDFGKVEWAKWNLSYLKDFFTDCSAYLARNYADYPLGEGVTEEFRQQVLQSIADIKIVVTGSGISQLDPEEHPMIFCPTIDKYHTETGKSAIDAWAEATGNVKWTYTCVNPQPPYSTYHIDDYLLSSRMLDWMMYEYDIVGNLYWATALTKDHGNNAATITDFYATSNRFPQANGDGFLIYPGNVYGLAGAVGSIRLQSIKDGAEDYNLLYALEQYYIDRASAKDADYDGSTFNNVLRCMIDTLYRGATCLYGAEYLNTFANARQSLADMLVLASKKGVIVENCVVEGDNAIFTVSAPSNVELAFNAAAKSTTANAITTYTVTIGADDALTVTVGENTLTLMPYTPLQVDKSWNDITTEETADGTIYPDAVIFTGNGTYSTVHGDNAAENSQGKISVVTLSDDDKVGGRTKGTYYLIDAKGKHLNQKMGFMLMPKEDKEYYETNYSDTAKLKFDVYFDVKKTTSSPQRLYYLMDQVGNQQKPVKTWYTFEIDLSTLLKNWDAFHNPTENDGYRQIALFSMTGSYGGVLTDYYFYIGEFRIEQ